MKQILSILILIVAFTSVKAQKKSVMKTERGNAYITKYERRISINNLEKDTLHIAPRDIDTFDSKEFLNIVGKTIFAIYRKDMCDFLNHSDNLLGFSMKFHNGTGRIIMLDMSILYKNHSFTEDMVSGMFVNKYFFVLRDSLNKRLNGFTIWSLKREEPYSGFQFVLSKRNMDEYMKTCSEEKQP